MLPLPSSGPVGAHCGTRGATSSHALRRKKAAGAGTVAELKVLVVGSMAVAVVAVVVLLLP